MREYCTMRLMEIDEPHCLLVHFSRLKTRTSQTTPEAPQSHLQHLLAQGWAVRDFAYVARGLLPHEFQGYVVVLEREVPPVCPECGGLGYVKQFELDQCVGNAPCPSCLGGVIRPLPPPPDSGGLAKKGL